MDDGTFAPEQCSTATLTNLFAGTREEWLLPVEAAELLNEVRAGIGRSPERARAAALRLVTLLTSASAAGRARGGLAPWQKRKIDHYVQEHLDHPLHLRQLAQEVGLSDSHFCRAFKQTFGITPHRHILRLRLQLAQRLMLTTRDPLSRVALACGLADQAHLSKLFRRWVGETPNAWRRRHFTGAEAKKPNGSSAQNGNPMWLLAA
jgi:AraC family transcriptional regulator